MDHNETLKLGSSRSEIQLLRPEKEIKSQSTPFGASAALAMKTLNMEPLDQIPIAWSNIMDIEYIENYCDLEPGTYKKYPERTYIQFQENIGICMIDQFVPENPLTMDKYGYEGHNNDALDTDESGISKDDGFGFYGQQGRSNAERGDGSLSKEVVRNGIAINSPESVAEHLESFIFPLLRQRIIETEENKNIIVDKMIKHETRLQQLFGPNILKTPYDPFEYYQSFPRLRYEYYGYQNYLMAFMLYPEIIEKDFSLQADLGEKRHQLAVKAMNKVGMPKFIRFDHDMADSRQTLVPLRMLENLWLPHLIRTLEPYLKAGVRVIWHCDGNLMGLLPMLLEAGIGGFQGFQYEDGMDYVKICKMRDKFNEPLLIWAGVSVTKTLPFGTPQDIRTEINWLVENGPKQGFFLSTSSSATPGIPRKNLDTLIEGFHHYRYKGRKI